MEIIRDSTIIAECPVCHTVLRLSTEDIKTSLNLSGFFICPTCNRHTVLYNSEGILNNKIRVKIIKNGDK